MSQPFFKPEPAKLIDTLAGDYRSLIQYRGSELAALEKTFGPIELLVKCYISPNAQNVNPADLPEDDSGLVSVTNVFQMLARFLAGTDPRFSHAFVLSDAGMGKTSLLIMLYLAFLDKLTQDGLSIVILKLGRQTSDQIKQVANPSKTILLLDALDEDPQAWQNFYTRLQEILFLTQNFRKTVITCRTQFFPSEKEEDGKAPGSVLLHGHRCSKVFMSPFDDQQVEAYLQKRFSSEELREKSRTIVAKMRSLKFRPMLLSYVDLLLNRDDVYENAFDLYEALVDEWLNRELRKNVVKDKGPIVAACTLIANHVFETNDRTIDRMKIDELTSHIDGLRAVEDMTIEGRSLLHRTSDGGYKFAHRSIMEFFVTKSLLTEPRPIRTSDQIKAFLLDHLRAKRRSKIKNLDLSATIVSKVAVPSLEAQSSNLSGTLFKDCLFHHGVFTGANLKSAQFRDCDLAHVNLTGTDASEAIFNNTKLTESLLNNAHFDGVVFKGCDLSLINSMGADLTETQIEATSVVGASFSNAKFDKGDFLTCIMEGSHFTKSSFVRAKFTGGSLVACSFKECTLDSSEFTGTNWAAARFSKSSLARVVVRDACLDGSEFVETNLEGASITQCTLCDAKLINCNMVGVDLSLSDLRGATMDFLQLRSSILAQSKCDAASFRAGDLTNCKAPSSRFSRADFFGCRLNDAVIDDCNFDHANLTEADLRNASAKGTSFRNAVVVRTDFRGADLSRADMSGLDLTVAKTDGVRLTGAKLEGSRIVHASYMDFTGCSFVSAKLAGATLDGAKLVRADLRNAHLVGAQLRKALMIDAVLNGADLKGATLEGADLSRADLRGADMTGAKVSGAIFKDTVYDSSTRLPAGLTEAQRAQIKTELEIAEQNARLSS